MTKLLFPFGISLALILMGTLVSSTIIKPNPFLVYSSDFVCLITGTRIIKEHRGETLYEIPTQLYYQQQIFHPLERTWLNPYRWPPFVTILFLPFANLPLIESYRLWAIFNIVLFSLLLLFFGKIFPWLTKDRRRLILPFFYLSVYFTIISGQTSLLHLLIFSLVYVSLESKKDKLSGLLCGLIAMKPQFLISVPFFFLLSKKKLNFLGGLFFSLVIINSLNTYLSGANYLFNYLDFSFKTETLEFGNRPYQMFSLFSTIISTPFLSKLPREMNLVINGVLYLLSLAYFVSKKGLLSFNRLFSSALIFTVIFSVHTLSHDLTFLLLPILLLFEEGYKITALILFLIPSAVFTGNTYFASLILLVIGFYLLKTNHQKQGPSAGNDQPEKNHRSIPEDRF